MRSIQGKKVVAGRCGCEIEMSRAQSASGQTCPIEDVVGELVSKNSEIR
jgi:hypothetical protein